MRLITAHLLTHVDKVISGFFACPFIDTWVNKIACSRARVPRPIVFKSKSVAMLRHFCFGQRMTCFTACLTLLVSITCGQNKSVFYLYPCSAENLTGGGVDTSEK
jgi:hypothetical protein